MTGFWHPLPASGGGGSSELPWLVDINPMMTPVSAVNWNQIGLDAGMIHNGALSNFTGAAINDEVNFDVLLSAGTWTFEIMFRRATSRGIVHFSLDGTEVGTVDQYGATASNIIGSISGVSVASSGKKRLKLQVASKNASSTGYAAYAQWIQLRRTA